MSAVPVTSGARRAGSAWVSAAVLLGYGAISFVFFGARLLTSPGSQWVGNKIDPQTYIWSFAWVPHAIVHGQNPLVTDAIWAPSGVNLTWTTFVPGLALLFAPITLLFGAVVSYNVAAVLLPALAAWTAFLLCRHVSRETWPSFVGGFLFGFSSYMLGHVWAGHLNLTATFLVPIAALVVLRAIEGELGPRGLVLRLGPVLAAEVLISTEILFTMTLALAVALAIAFALVRNTRARIKELLLPLAGAYLLAGLLASPFLYYVLRDPVRTSISLPAAFVTDALDFVVPSLETLVSRGWEDEIARHFTTNPGERGAFLGLPLILILVLFARQRWQTPAGRFLLVTFALSAFLGLGGHLTIYGHTLVPLPWGLINGLPVFNNVLTVRFALYTSLAVAVIATMWTASRPRGDHWRWLLPALAMLMLLPNFGLSGWATTYTVPAFFTDSAYEGCLEPGEIVLPLPIQDTSLWQVEDDFRFRMAGGRVAASPPPPFMTPEFANVSQGAPLTPSDAGKIAGYIKAKGVTTVILDKTAGTWWTKPALDTLAHGQDVGGVLLYRFGATDRPCAAAR